MVIIYASLVSHFTLIIKPAYRWYIALFIPYYIKHSPFTHENLFAAVAEPKLMKMMQELDIV